MIHPITAEQMQRDYLWAAHCNPSLTQGMTAKQEACEYAEHRGIEVRDFFGPARVQSVAHPRQDFMRKLRQRGMTLSEIGRMFDRDHTTVKYGIRASERRASQ